MKDSKVIQLASGHGILAAVNQVAPTRHQSAKPSYRCGKSNHKASDCYYKETFCSRCKKKRHLAKACRNQITTNPLSTTGKQQQNQSTHFVEVTLDGQNEPSEYSLFTVNNFVHGKGTDSNLFTINVLTNKQPVDLRIDTGAAISIMSEATYEQLWSQGNSPPVEINTVSQLSTYSSVILETVVTVTYEIEYQNQKCQVIVKHPGPTLLGRKWLYHIRLDWPQLAIHKCYLYKIRP